MKTIEVIRVLTIVAFVLKSTVSMAQPDSVYIDNNTDSDTVLFAGSNEVQEKQALVLKHRNPYKFNPVQLVVPGTLIGVGIIGLESDWLKYQNKEIKEELQENIDRKFTIDDFSQYVPMAATYGLNQCGVKGKHGYGDLTIILNCLCANGSYGERYEKPYKGRTSRWKREKFISVRTYRHSIYGRRIIEERILECVALDRHCRLCRCCGNRLFPNLQQ